MSQTHNLDEGTVESFNFIVKGHEYSFRHLNTEEMEEARKLENDEAKSKDFLFKFITKVNPDSPDFSEVSKKMITSQWRKFKAMLEAEMGE